MEKPLTPAEIVSIGLENLQYLINHYPIINATDIDSKVHVQGYIGHYGMGPEIRVSFLGNKYDETLKDVGVDIELWRHHEPLKYVLIYLPIDPKTDELENQSVDLTSIADARPFFEKAMQVFGLTAR